MVPGQPCEEVPWGKGDVVPRIDGSNAWAIDIGCTNCQSPSERSKVGLKRRGERYYHEDESLQLENYANGHVHCRGKYKQDQLPLRLSFQKSDRLLSPRISQDYLYLSTVRAFSSLLSLWPSLAYPVQSVSGELSHQIMSLSHHSSIKCRSRVPLPPAPWKSRTRRKLPPAFCLPTPIDLLKEQAPSKSSSIMVFTRSLTRLSRPCACFLSTKPLNSIPRLAQPIGARALSATSSRQVH